MSTVIENIDSLFSVKSDIRQAIEDKGVDMSNTPFTSFAVKISEIPSGGGGDTDIEDGLISGRLTGNYTNARVTGIKSYAFYNQQFLNYVNFPNVSIIGDYAFAFVNLSSYSFPKASYIGDHAFWSCYSITETNFPLVEKIGTSAFYYCPRLTTAYFPVCTSIGTSAFGRCSGLTTVDFSVCPVVGGYAFDSCTSLTTVSFPVCSTIGNFAFAKCSALPSVSFPVCTSIGSNAFASCSALTSVNLPVCSVIGSYAFNGCSSLSALYLNNVPSVTTLSNSNAFTNTPMVNSTYLGYYGSIYVPMSLVDQFKSKTNWTYFADRIVGV